MPNSSYICGEIARIDPLVTKRYQASFSPFFCLVLLNSLVMKTNSIKTALPGQKFGMLTIIREIPRFDKKGNKVRYVECLCDCGNLKRMFVSNFKKPWYANANCGCVSPHSKHGMVHTKLYKVWGAMVERCSNPHNHAYHNYGGRGITVCEEWKRSENFFKWALASGYKDGLEIDRENNEANYTPSNCRFVTRQVNTLNRRKQKDHGIYYYPKEDVYRIFIVRNLVRHDGGKSKSLENARILRDNLENSLKCLLP
jgi:hypothetical protein